MPRAYSFIIPTRRSSLAHCENPDSVNLGFLLHRSSREGETSSVEFKNTLAPLWAIDGRVKTCLIYRRVCTQKRKILVSPPLPQWPSSLLHRRLVRGLGPQNSCGALFVSAGIHRATSGGLASSAPDDGPPHSWWLLLVVKWFRCFQSAAEARPNALLARTRAVLYLQGRDLIESEESRLSSFTNHPVLLAFFNPFNWSLFLCYLSSIWILT